MRVFLWVLCFWCYCEWEHFPITANRLLLVYYTGIISHVYTHKFTDLSLILGVSPPGVLLLVGNYVVYYKKLLLGFPGGTVVKNPPAIAGDMRSSPGPGRSHMPRSN